MALPLSWLDVSPDSTSPKSLLKTEERQRRSKNALLYAALLFRFLILICLVCFMYLICLYVFYLWFYLLLLSNPFPHRKDPLIYSRTPSAVSTLVCVVTSSATLIRSSCSSDRRFADGFIQIPAQVGHPCLKLWLTSNLTTRNLILDIEYMLNAQSKFKRIVVLPLIRNRQICINDMHNTKKYCWYNSQIILKPNLS